MRALELLDVGFDRLRWVDREVVRPRGDQVLLKMKAAAIGLRDYKLVSGAYAQADDRRPLIPGGEGVAEVVEIGPEVLALRVGERVNPIFVQGWLDRFPHARALATTLGGPLLDGTFAEYLVVRERSVVKVPEHLTDPEAATLPFAGLTAWNAVAEQGRVRAGEVVFVQGTGGIALFALQFAKLLGATVIVSSKNDEKLARARTLGADHVVNYEAVPAWSQRVLELTEGAGADLVMDPGGTVTMAQSIRAVRPGGTICVFNALGSAELGVFLPLLLAHNVRVQGTHAGSREMHEAMARAIARSGLRPVIERVVLREGAVDAIAAMPKSEQFGKVCLQLQ